MASMIRALVLASVLVSVVVTAAPTEEDGLARMKKFCDPVLELTQMSSTEEKAVVHDCKSVMVENKIWPTMIDPAVRRISAAVGKYQVQYPDDFRRTFWEDKEFMMAQEPNHDLEFFNRQLCMDIRAPTEVVAEKNEFIQSTCASVKANLDPYRGYVDGLRSIVGINVYQEIAIRNREFFNVLAVDSYCSKFTECGPKEYVKPFVPDEWTKKLLRAMEHSG